MPIPKTAEGILKVLLATGHCLIHHEMMLGVRKQHGKFRVQYDVMNEGAWLGNQPLGAKLTTRNQALHAVAIFPKTIPGCTKRAYRNVNGLAPKP